MPWSRILIKTDWVTFSWIPHCGLGVNKGYIGGAVAIVDVDDSVQEVNRQLKFYKN